MLDSKTLDFTRRLIQADIKKCRESFYKELSQTKRKLQLSGNSPETSSSGKKIICDMFTQEMKTEGHIAWKSLLWGHEASGSQLTKILAFGFKEAVKSFLEEFKKELLEFMMRQTCFAKDDTANLTLNSAKEDVFEEINIKIDFYVNSLMHHSHGKRKSKIVRIIRGLILGIPWVGNAIDAALFEKN